MKWLGQMTQWLPRRSARRQYLAVDPVVMGIQPAPMLESWIWRFAATMTVLGMLIPGFRYLSYGSLALAVLLAIADRRVVVRGLAPPFLFLVFAGLLMWPLTNKAGWKDLYFIASAISISLVLSRVRLWPELLLGCFVLGNMFVAYRSGGLAHGFLFNLADSESSFEGSFGFLFGLLFIYFFVHKRWWWALATFVLSVLALKRIVLVAEVAVALVLMLPARWQRRLTHPALMIAANLGVVALLLMYANHVFDDVIMQLTGLSPNHFGKGRQALYLHVTRQILADPWQFVLWGDGPGSAYDTLTIHGAFAAGAGALHSDVIKILYEYGLVAFMGFFWLGYRHANANVRALFLYANVLFVSDNVLIYHFFIFFLVAFARVFEQEGEGAPAPLAGAAPASPPRAGPVSQTEPVTSRRLHAS